eukprot:gene25847-26012_t
MRTILTLGVAAAALLGATAAQAASVEFKDAVARVVVIPEDRADVKVEFLTTNPGLPLTVRRRFALAAWKRSVDRAYQRGGVSALGYGDPAGEPALRQALSHHLAVARGVLCMPEQVVITEGAQEALALCVRLVANPGDTAWLEDPGYRGAQTAFACGDMQLVPMPVDGSGLAVPEGAWAAQPPRLVYTSPSHQYPTGAVLSAARRLALIQQAQRHGAWLIEDDYDSEFHYAGKPTACVQGLDAHDRTIYIGTFTKSMFPGLRIGYMVLPSQLVAPMTVARTLQDGHSASIPQLTLARFME